MPLEHSHQPEDLLDTTLTDEELHELLRRLGESSLGGPESPTVKAVAEATGSSPIEIGHLLAEIRKQAIADHSERLEKLEAEKMQPVDRVQQEALQAVAQREILRRSARPVLFLFLAVILIGLILSAIFTPQPAGPHMDWSVSVTAASPQIEHWTDGKFRVQKVDGTYRFATHDEIALAQRLSGQ